MSGKTNIRIKETGKVLEFKSVNKQHKFIKKVGTAYDKIQKE